MNLPPGFGAQNVRTPHSPPDGTTLSWERADSNYEGTLERLKDQLREVRRLLRAAESDKHQAKQAAEVARTAAAYQQGLAQAATSEQARLRQENTRLIKENDGLRRHVRCLQAQLVPTNKRDIFYEVDQAAQQRLHRAQQGQSDTSGSYSPTPTKDVAGDSYCSSKRRLLSISPTAPSHVRAAHA